MRSQQERESLSAEYRNLDREVERKCRKDKNAWWHERSRKAALRNDTKMLYQIVRELTKTVNNTSIPVKDKTGNTLLTEKQQNAWLIEHFGEVLNQPEPTTTLQLDNTHPVSELEVNTGTITEEEVRNAVHQLKNNKAAGLDEIAGEMLK